MFTTPIVNYLRDSVTREVLPYFFDNQFSTLNIESKVQICVVVIFYKITQQCSTARNERLFISTSLNFTVTIVQHTSVSLNEVFNASTQKHKRYSTLLCRNKVYTFFNWQINRI